MNVPRKGRRGASILQHMRNDLQNRTTQQIAQPDLSDIEHAAFLGTATQPRPHEEVIPENERQIRELDDEFVQEFVQAIVSSSLSSQCFLSDET